MYILKNALKNIWRNKSRNILIGIIVLVLSAACSVAIAIMQSASDIVSSYEESNQITATISMDRSNLMQSFKDEDGQNLSGEEMINAFNDLESLTQEEIENYGDSTYLKSYYYTYSLGINAKNLTELTDSLVKETTETTTDTKTREFDQNMPGMPGGGFREDTTTTKTTTEKIYNEKAQNGAFTLVGYDSYESMSEFINGTYKISEGEISSDFESNNVVISSELASANDLSVGDSITLVSTNNTKKTYEVTITGIYEETDAETDDMSKMFSSSANQIITNLNLIKKILADDEDLTATISPTFILNSKDDFESFESEVTEKGLASYYTLSSNIEEIESATQSISNVKTFATTFLIITLAIGGIVLVVINMINIRERKYEIGVLRTIGMKKSILSMQFILELLVVSFCFLLLGAGIGACTSVPVANNLLESEITSSVAQTENIADNFKAGDNEQMKEDFKDMNFGVSKVNQVDNINAVMDFAVLMKLLGIGLALTLLSSLASMISIARFSPLTILKERS